MSLAGSCFSSESALVSWDPRTRRNNLYRDFGLIAFVVGNENCLQLPPEPPVATREPRRRRRSIYCVFISPR